MRESLKLRLGKDVEVTPHTFSSLPNSRVLWHVVALAISFLGCRAFGRVHVSFMRACMFDSCTAYEFVLKNAHGHTHTNNQELLYLYPSSHKSVYQADGLLHAPLGSGTFSMGTTHCKYLELTANTYNTLQVPMGLLHAPLGSGTLLVPASALSTFYLLVPAPPCHPQYEALNNRALNNRAYCGHGAHDVLAASDLLT